MHIGELHASTSEDISRSLDSKEAMRKAIEQCATQRTRIPRIVHKLLICRLSPVKEEYLDYLEYQRNKAGLYTPKGEYRISKPFITMNGTG